MRQAVIHVVSGDLWGGAENQIWQLVEKQLARPELLVCVIILNQGQLFEKLTASGAKVCLCDESRESFVHILKQSHSFVRKIRQSTAQVVLHSHRRKENLIALLIAVAEQLPAVRTLHGADEHAASASFATRIAKMVEQHLYKWVFKAHVVVAKHLKSELEASNFRSGKIHTISNGINFDALRATGFTTSARELSLSTKLVGPVADVRFKIGIVGRLVPVKRHDLFVRLADRMIEGGANFVHFFVIGDGPLLESTQAAAGHSAARHNVHFFGFVRNVHEIIAEMDAVLILSDHEGLPLNLLESIALDVIVLGHNVGGVGEILQPYPALLLEAPLIESAEQALWHLINGNVPLRDQFRQCRAEVTSRFSIERCEQAYHRLYFSPNPDNES